MKKLLIGIAAAGLVGVAGAQAGEQHSSSTATDTSSKDSASKQTSSSQTPSTQTPSSQSSSSQATSSGTGTSATASNELSGVVKKVDADKKSLSISSPAGGEQELKVGESATITRDGSQASLDQIKEGDQVRASLGSSGDQASTIQVTSKQKAKSDSSDTKSLMKEKQ